MPSPARTRPYRSTLRTEQADRTRRRILEAAGETFAAHGYQATTIAAIARAAQVSTESVKSAGSKSELLVRAFEVTFAGTEGVDSLTDSDAASGVLDLPDGELVAAVVEVIAGANAVSSRLWTVLLGAALSDPGVDEALQTMLTHRRRDYRGLVEELVRRGIGARGTDVDRVAAELSFLMSPEGHQQLVSQSGWSESEYRDWLAAVVVRAVS